MDRSGEKKEDEDEVAVVLEVPKSPAAAAGGGDGASQPRAPRRCVQKKLVFSESRVGGDDREEGEDEYEESEGERKGKRKRKGKPRAAAPRKTQSRKESCGPCKGGNNTVIAAASDFFTKVSEKRLQQKQVKEQSEDVALNVVNDEFCKASEFTKGTEICRKSKRSDGDSTPSKDITPDKSKEPCSQRCIVNKKSNVVRTPVAKTADKDQPVLDLWLEAKAAAEENQRLSVGRQTHPFFSCWKATRRVSNPLEIAKVQNKRCVALNDCLPPIHVLDAVQDDTASLDWTNWNFSEGNLIGLNGSCAPETSALPIFECFAEPLKFDSASNVSNLYKGLFPSKEGFLDPLLDKEEALSGMSKGAPYFLTGREEVHQQLFSYLKMVHVNNNIYQPTGCNSSTGNLEELQERQLQERFKTYQLSRGCYSEYSLWTNKYQPEKASEVCGNVEAVKVVGEWLKSWHERGLRKSSALGKASMPIDCTDISSQSDSDIDIEDEGAELGNVLLVTGPVGCGKSAAIYACAKELGFEVIEVNASDQRNGALIKQKFGEAMESLGLDLRTLENNNSRVKGQTLGFTSALHDNGVDEFNNDDLEVISVTCEQDNRAPECSKNTMENKTTICQVANKSLILFEDVDTVFDEDRGFIGIILQLAESSKRPMILTTNSKEPVLPQVLNRHVVDFVLPSHEELLSHISMICAAEGILVSPLLLKRFIVSCQADIRKTIFHVQFWCQGKRKELGKKRHCMYSPLHFDIDAAHLIIPEVVPWGFPCTLSEKVTMEISKINPSIEENLFLIDKLKLQGCKSMDIIDDSNVDSEIGTTLEEEDDTVKNRCIIDCNKFPSPFKDDGSISDVSESQVKFSRRTVRGRSAAVLFSESEDENANDNPDKDIRSVFFNSDQSPDVSVVALSNTVECPDHLDLSIDLMDQSKMHESLQCSLWITGTATASNICDMYKSLDVSCIPESDLVLEVESNQDSDLISRMVPSSHLRTVKSIDNLPETGDGCLDKTKLDFNMGSPNKCENTFELDAESVHGNEELQDLESESIDFLKRQWQMMDECSRADFSLKNMSEEHIDRIKVTDPVQEMWKRLRSCGGDLKLQLTDDQKVASEALIYTSGMTSLISDSEIMLSGCESRISDCLEPPMVPHVEPVSVSWYDEQLDMVSTFAQHGLCFYANKSASLGSKLGREKMVYLAHEMLSSSTSTMALGKLLSQEHIASEDLWNGRVPQIGKPSCGLSLIREVESKFYSTIRLIVPERLSMAIKGHAFHEYLSVLSQISKTENSRHSKNINGTQRQRRVRASRHYLKSCPISLPSEDVELLAQHCCFGGVGFG